MNLTNFGLYSHSSFHQYSYYAHHAQSKQNPALGTEFKNGPLFPLFGQAPLMPRKLSFKGSPNDNAMPSVQKVCLQYEKAFHEGGNTHQIRKVIAATEGFVMKHIHAMPENDLDALSLDSGQIPPTPNKKTPEDNNSVNNVECPVSEVCRQVKNGNLYWKNCILKLAPTQYRKGDYHQIHQIIDIDGIPPIPHVNWRSCLVKTLHPLRIYQAGKRSGRATAFRKRIAYHENAWQQFWQLKEVGIAVVPVYNNPALDFFWLMPRVPPLPPERIPEKDFDLTDKQWALLFRVAEICRLAITHQIHIDLRPENFYIQPNGELALLDFREEQNPEDIEMDLRKGLRKFHNQNPEAKNLLKRYLGDLILWHLEEEF
ncbi:MAG: hypothetical protein WB791_05860 [Waddliaceae bacterium]